MRFKLFLPTLQSFSVFKQVVTNYGENMFDFHREVMVNNLHLSGLRSPKVLHAMSLVPRHEFVPDNVKEMSYENTPLPIGYSQTISQPLIVADMIDIVDISPTDTVLEIGSGCGYNAAVMSRLAKKVYSVEIIPELHKMAKENIERVGYENVELFLSDGGCGLPEHAPFDVIVVTAASPSVPIALKEQLAVKGRMVIPVNKVGTMHEMLTKVEKLSEDQFKETEITAVRFVPLIGASVMKQRE